MRGKRGGMNADFFKNAGGGGDVIIAGGGPPAGRGRGRGN